MKLFTILAILKFHDVRAVWLANPILVPCIVFENVTPVIGRRIYRSSFSLS